LIIGVLGGTAGLGKGLAARLAQTGHQVKLGSRSIERAKATARELMEMTNTRNIIGLTNEEAAEGTDVVIVSIPFTGIYETAKVIRKVLREDTIVVSPIVPLESEIGGQPRYIELPSGSAAESLRDAIGGRFQVVSAFCNLPSKPLMELENAIDCDVVVCGDHEASETVMELAESIPNIRAIYGGGLVNARIVERLTSLIVSLNRLYNSDRVCVKFTGIEKQLRDSMRVMRE